MKGVTSPKEVKSKDVGEMLKKAVERRPNVEENDIESEEDDSCAVCPDDKENGIEGEEDDCNAVGPDDKEIDIEVKR